MAVRDFLLPDLGEGLEDAEVITWKVSEGDRIELNQTLVMVTHSEEAAAYAHRIIRMRDGRVVG